SACLAAPARSSSTRRHAAHRISPRTPLRAVGRRAIDGPWLRASSGCPGRRATGMATRQPKPDAEGYRRLPDHVEEALIDHFALAHEEEHSGRCADGASEADAPRPAQIRGEK